MAYPRRLDDEALAAARLEYETAPISTRTLGAKFRLIEEQPWANGRDETGWVKFRCPQEIERQLEHDIRVEAQATEGAAFAKGLARSLRATCGDDRPPDGRRAPKQPGQQSRTPDQTRPR